MLEKTLRIVYFSNCTINVHSLQAHTPCIYDTRLHVFKYNDTRVVIITAQIYTRKNKLHELVLHVYFIFKYIYMSETVALSFKHHVCTAQCILLYMVIV